MLTIADTASGRITIYERDLTSRHSHLRVVTAEELAKRSMRCYSEEVLAEAAMCGMFPGPYGPEDYGS